MNETTAIIVSGVIVNGLNVVLEQNISLHNFFDSFIVI